MNTVNTDLNMKILLVAATRMEIEPLIAYLNNHYQQQIWGHFFNASHEVQVLITGVGQAQTAYSLGLISGQSHFDWWINAGIAGAFDRQLQMGNVVEVVSDRFADLGVEEADGRFLSMHDLGLIPKDIFPFKDGQLQNPTASEFAFLPKVDGLTVNRVHGFEPSIQAISEKYVAQIETMESAAFFYGALMQKVAFTGIRSISNYVEPRNRGNWQVTLAIEQLNHVLIEILHAIG